MSWGHPNGSASISRLVYSGYWQIGGPDGIRLATKLRPNAVHRLTCRLLLGICWHEGWDL